MAKIFVFLVFAFTTLFGAYENEQIGRAHV